MVRRGQLGEQEALHHPHRSVLTRVLGGGPDVAVDAATHATVEGDRLLACTDGLVNKPSDDEIGSLMAETVEVEATADALVELGHDNVSVVVSDACS